MVTNTSSAARRLSSVTGALPDPKSAADPRATPRERSPAKSQGQARGLGFPASDAENIRRRSLKCRSVLPDEKRLVESVRLRLALGGHVLEIIERLEPRHPAHAAPVGDGSKPESSRIRFRRISSVATVSSTPVFPASSIDDDLETALGEAVRADKRRAALPQPGSSQRPANPVRPRPAAAWPHVPRRMQAGRRSP